MPVVCLAKCGKVLEWTSAAEDISGVPRDSAIGCQFVEDLVVEGQKASVRAALRQACRGVGLPRLELQIAHRGQTSSTLLFGVSPWRSENGEVAGAVGTFEDPTMVNWSLKAHSELIGQANAMVFALDLDGHVTEWNAQAGQISGWPREAMLRQSLPDKVPAEAGALRQALAAAKDGITGEPFVLCFPGDRPVLAGASLQRSVTGAVVGVLCVGHVLTEQVGTYLPGGGSQADDRDGLASMRTIKGMVMHEMRSPLHGIIGLANTLSTDETPHQRPLKMIAASAERVLDLVTNLMDYLNLSKERPSNFGFEDQLQMDVIVTEMVARLEGCKDKRGKPLMKDSIELLNDVSPDLPSAMGDAQSVSTMLYHLLTNAFKFTTQGRVKIYAEKVSQPPGISISVEDTGCGIAAQNIDRMLEPFQQEDPSEARKHDGIGIGLAIVREVVRLHSGELAIRSLQGEGSTFTVSLPFQPKPASGPPATGAAKAQSPKQQETPRLLGGGADGLVRQTTASSKEVRSTPWSWLGPVGSAGFPPLPLKWVPRQPPPSGSPDSGPADGAAAGAGGAGAEAVVRSPAPSGPSMTMQQALAQQQAEPQVVRAEEVVIMSVDDDHINQEVMRSVLEPLGFKIIVCMSGHECLQYMKQPNSCSPCLILLDLMMPGIDGFSVLREVRKMFSLEQLPVLMVSAKNQASSVVKGLELGCNDWIHKPFDRQELIARVKTQLLLRTIILSYWSSAQGVGAQPDSTDGQLSAEPKIQAAAEAANADKARLQQELDQLKAAAEAANAVKAQLQQELDQLKAEPRPPAAAAQAAPAAAAVEDSARLKRDLESRENELMTVTMELRRMQENMKMLEARASAAPQPDFAAPFEGAGAPAASAAMFARGDIPIYGRGPHLGDANGDVPVPNTMSVRFLQWQLTHLQADVRFYQEALAAERTRHQQAATRVENLEKNNALLMDQTEHLQLQLGFHAAMSGMSGGSRSLGAWANATGPMDAGPCSGSGHPYYSDLLSAGGSLGPLGSGLPHSFGLSAGPFGAARFSQGNSMGALSRPPFPPAGA